MPYIKQADRDRVNNDLRPQTVGELNYLITSTILDYIKDTGGLSYGKINEVMGVLSCVGQEFYFRIARPYESHKMVENGDIPEFEELHPYRL